MYAEAIAQLKGLVEETTRPKYSASEAAAAPRCCSELASLYRTNGQYTEAVDTYRKAAA